MNHILSATLKNLCRTSFFAKTLCTKKTLVRRYRSSRSEVFLGKGVLKICSKFTGEHPCRSVISIKLLCFCRYTEKDRKI